jgi:dTMP kinase
MTARGKFIVIEGIDGSGKRTQLDLLARAFDQRSIPYGRVGFPNYQGFFGKLVARFLNGDFGSLDAVDPHFSALLYAGDRYESKPAMEEALAAGKNLLSDRYIGSNLAHQGARVAPEKRAEFLEWLGNLEYKIYGLPAEDLVIYLYVPVDEADRLIGKRAKRQYTELRRDLQEADRRHLEAAARVYGELAQQPNWVRIDCADRDGKLRPPDQIHNEVLGMVGGMMFASGGLESLRQRAGE